MPVERRMQRVLDKLVKNIQLDMDVLNYEGYIVASSLRDRIGTREDFLRSNATVEERDKFIYGGRTYMKLDPNTNHTYYLSIEGTDKVIRNYCYLAVSLMGLYLKSTDKPMDREEIIAAAMVDRIPDLDFQEAIQEYNIEIFLPRCVIVVRTLGMEAPEIYRIMENVFPGDRSDFLVLMDSRTIGLVKALEEDSDEDELIQLGEAIEDTILNETMVKSFIGIGKVRNSIYEIKKSYDEALMAIDIGSIYEPNTSVHTYERLLLERFLYEVPMELSRKYYKHIFQGEFEKLLTDEMITTIEKFFENSLNLSETSRQLYIHRNTLVYRLDKVQKALGLDLRNFHDAVTFKIMMMLERQNRECSN